MRKSYKKYYALFVIPTLAAYVIAFVIPFVMGLGLSFCKFKTLKHAHFVGLSNYVYVFTQNSGFLEALWFTVKIAVVGVVTTNLNYRPPELLEREWYAEADMTEYLATIIDHLNHDISISGIQSPTAKINQLLQQLNS